MTGTRDRMINMHAFAEEALKLLEQVLIQKNQDSKL